jgi:hypothetical protein
LVGKEEDNKTKKVEVGSNTNSKATEIESAKTKNLIY